MRIAVLSDVHGNALALEAVLADIGRQATDVICNLGDHFSGPVDPLGTAQLLRGFDAISILGNHDRYLLDEAPEDMSKVDRIAIEALRPCDLDWLRSLPETDVVGDVLYLCHGTPASDDTHWLQTKDADGRFFPTAPDVIASACEEIALPLICCGHSHVARAVKLENGQIVFNPGSVGRPAYTMADPTSIARLSPDAGYALVTQKGAEWDIELRQVPYDYMSAAQQARDHGAKTWAKNLEMGWQR